MSVKSHPSLALIKYWGKDSVSENTPATSSLALNLKAFETTTHITLSDQDSVLINGKQAQMPRYAPFFAKLRHEMQTNAHFSVESHNNFPTAAGLASSSAGFAAMAYGCAKLTNKTATREAISSCARLGSASAARSVFGGFTTLKRNELAAKELHPASHWPSLRVIIAIVKTEAKAISSREAMQHCQQTSPFYSKWIENSDSLFSQALDAVAKCDLETLGPLMQQSYQQMFSTLHTAIPPIFYWEPESSSLIKSCEHLRKKGFSIWETMDAGPQVKMLCDVSELDEILCTLKETHPQVTFLVSEVGPETREVP